MQKVVIPRVMARWTTSSNVLAAWPQNWPEWEWWEKGIFGLVGVIVVRELYRVLPVIGDITCRFNVVKGRAPAYSYHGVCKRGDVTVAVFDVHIMLSSIIVIDVSRGNFDTIERGVSPFTKNENDYSA